MATTRLELERVSRVAVLTLSRPPHNFFDVGLLTQLADAVAAIDSDPMIRAIVLASKLRSFCAGADFEAERPDPAPIYAQAVRLMSRRKPLIAAINGAAIGGGLGLALVADMRVGSAEARFQANFVRLGISAGFGISFTLPRVVGSQAARNLLLTGRRIKGEEAFSMGLLDRLTQPDTVLPLAINTCEELAGNAPAAMVATRRLLDEDIPEAFAKAVSRELGFQQSLFMAKDFEEGVRAVRDKRPPQFQDTEESQL
jgi:2-(1,2-epoxy-1,2-dihydrophenyl)acetyl-CoA isomerase